MPRGRWSTACSTCANNEERNHGQQGQEEGIQGQEAATEAGDCLNGKAIAAPAGALASQFDAAFLERLLQEVEGHGVVVIAHGLGETGELAVERRAQQ